MERCEYTQVCHQTGQADRKLTLKTTIGALRRIREEAVAQVKKQEKVQEKEVRVTGIEGLTKSIEEEEAK